MATIRKRGDYQWQAQIRQKGHHASMTFTHRSEAEQWVRKLESEMDAGIYQDRSEADRTALAVALDRYVNEVSLKKKGRGYECNRSQVKSITKYPLSQIMLSRIDTAAVSQYRDTRLKAVSAKTVLLELGLISHLFTIAQQEWGMPYLINPVKIIKKPSPSRARDRRLEGDEESRLLASARIYSQSAYVLIVFAIETAMRRGEMAGLRWTDIKKNIATLEDTKNGETRHVPLSTRALSVLDSLPRQLHDNRVFCLTADAISTAMARICKRAKSADGETDQPIVGLRFHDLRHEATSRLFEKGLNPMQVAAITGHKTLQMLKRYTHLRAEDLAKMLG